MKKTVKTSEILSVYQIIGNAKYGKMSDDDKVKVWKIARKLKPIATKFEDDTKDAADKMKPYEDFDQKLQKAQEYERLKNDKKPTIDVMSTADYDNFIADFKQYKNIVDKAIKEFADKEVEIEFDAISEEAFGKLITSNEWTFGQVTLVGDFICE
jgi:hypothetical protein